MTVKEMSALIGQIGMLKVEDLRVEVEIMDVKQSYGSTRIQVTPTHGIGHQWVSIDRVSL